MLNRMLCPMFTQIGPLPHPGAPKPETTHYFLTLTAAVWPGASRPGDTLPRDLCAPAIPCNLSETSHSAPGLRTMRNRCANAYRFAGFLRDFFNVD